MPANLVKPGNLRWDKPAFLTIPDNDGVWRTFPLHYFVDNQRRVRVIFDGVDFPYGSGGSIGEAVDDMFTRIFGEPNADRPTG